MKRKKIFSKRAVFYGFGVFLVFAIAIFLIVVYTRYSTSEQARGVARFLHLPVVITVRPFSVLTATQLQWRLSSLRQFYEKQDFSALGMRVDFSTEEGEKRLRVRERGIINKNIEDAVIRDIVNTSGMRVTETEMVQSVVRKLHEFGSEESVKDDLDRLYGWDIQDFQREVVQPDLYKEKVAGIFEARQDRERDDRASQKIEEAFRQLESGISFAEVAKQYSEGSTIENGGEIGWIDISQAEPDLAEAIENLSVGARTDIVETVLGFHIVQLHEVRKESGIKLYRVSQIMTRKETLADWVGDFVQKTSVFVFLPGYEWNAESGYVEFVDASLIEFEKKSDFIEEGASL